MAAVTFDTLKFAERLRAGGFSDAQAKAAAEAFADATSQELATKSDLRELRVDLEHRLESLEQRLVIKLGGMLVVAIGIIATLIKLL